MKSSPVRSVVTISKARSSGVAIATLSQVHNPTLAYWMEDLIGLIVFLQRSCIKKAKKKKPVNTGGSGKEIG